jgi:hypothetical protein
MFTITDVSNNQLKSIYLSDKTFKVEIKYKDGTWKDITSYVEAIEIIEQLTYDGNSPMNKAGISLSNINGEFSPAKVGAPFNEPVVTGSSRTFLTTKFPIRISVTANSTAYTIFRGYAHTVKDEGLKATIEAYDILYYLARKRYKKALSFANKTAKDIVQAIWNEVKSKIETDFETVITLTFIPDVPTSKVLINTDAKTYLEALNKVVSGTGGYFNYRAFTNELIFVFMGDASYTNPTTDSAVTFATANTINKFALEQQVDVANSVTVSVNTYVDKYNPPQTVDDWWYTSFVDKDGKFAPNNGIMMPAGSVSMFDIDFGKVGYDPEQTLVLTLYTYSEETKSDGSKVYLAGGKKIITIDFGSNFSTAVPFDVSLSDWGTIRVLDYQIKAQGVWLKIQNNTGLNLSIAEARMRVKPLLESGKNTAEYKVNDPDTEVFVEQSIDTIFIDKSAMQKMAEAVLKLRGARITGEVELSQFAPFLTVGGVVKITLNDTNFNSTDVLLTEVKHTIRKGLCTTSFQFAHVFTLSTTIANESGEAGSGGGGTSIIGDLLPPTTFLIDYTNQRLVSSIPKVKISRIGEYVYKYFYNIDWVNTDGEVVPKVYTLYPQPSYTFTRSSTAYLPSGPMVDANKLRLIDSNDGKAVLVEEGTTNLIEQWEPGASQDWTKWDHWNNSTFWYLTTQSDDPVWGKLFYGRAPSVTQIFNYSPTVSITANTPYTFSFYIKTSANLTPSFDAYFRRTDGTMIVTATKTYSLTANTWSRIEITVTPTTSNTSAQYGVRIYNIPDNQEFWIAYPQIEAKKYATTFINGTRANEELKIPAYNILNSTEGTIEMRVYIPDYSQYPQTNDWRKFFTVVEGNTTDPTKEKLSLYFVRSNNQLQVGWNVGGTVYPVCSFGSSPSLLAGYKYLVVRWKAGKDLALFVDGMLVGYAISISALQITPNDYIYLGGSPLFWSTANVNYSNIAIDSIRISNIARSDKYISDAYNTNAVFEYDRFTTYLENFNSEFQYSDGTNFYIPLEYSMLRRMVTIWGEWTDGSLTSKTVFDIGSGR